MTADEKQLEVAKQYVDTQLATMKKYGSAPPKMSTQEYRALVQEVVDTLQSNNLVCIRYFSDSTPKRSLVGAGSASFLRSLSVPAELDLNR